MRPGAHSVGHGLVALNFNRQAAARRFPVFGVHVFTGLVHGLNDFIERDARFAGAAHGHPAGVDRFDGGNGVTFDSRHLYLAGHRVAGEAKVVLHADFRRHADLLGAGAKDFRQARSGH